MSPIAHSYSTLQPVCPLFLIVLRRFERRECPWWLKTEKLCHHLSHIFCEQSLPTLQYPSADAWVFFYINVFFCGGFLNVSNGCTTNWVSCRRSSVNQHYRLFFGILGGVGVRVCMVVAAGVQPIIMLIEESSDVEELMRHGILAEPANHSPLRTRQLLTNCEKLPVINHTKRDVLCHSHTCHHMVAHGLFILSHNAESFVVIPPSNQNNSPKKSYFNHKMHHHPIFFSKDCS